jgi:hypothetical protein
MDGLSSCSGARNAVCCQEAAEDVFGFIGDVAESRGEGEAERREGAWGS